MPIAQIDNDRFNLVPASESLGSDSRCFEPVTRFGCLVFTLDVVEALYLPLAPIGMRRAANSRRPFAVLLQRQRSRPKSSVKTSGRRYATADDVRHGSLASIQ
jgi:hypothetical protein